MANVIFLEDNLFLLTKEEWTISGTVKDIEDNPLERNVKLYNATFSVLIDEQFSDPGTGAFSFTVSSNENNLYTVLCVGDEKLGEHSVVYNNVTVNRT